MSNWFLVCHFGRTLRGIKISQRAGRWYFRVASPSVDSDFVATSARNGKIRLRALESETLAVIRVPGRPIKLTIQHAETAIRPRDRHDPVATDRWRDAETTYAASGAAVPGTLRSRRARN
jgi:hypothetical protein